MTNQIEILVTKAMGYLEATEGFVQEQAPLVVQEVIIFGRWEHSIQLVLASMMLVIGVILIIRKAKDCFMAEPTRHDLAMLAYVAVALMGVATLNLKTTIQVWVAPRLYIIDYLKDLMA